VVLKAVLFDFNGIIINDESIHRELIDELLLSENLKPQGKEYLRASLGRIDRIYISELLKLRGRFVDDKDLDKLVVKKSIAYSQRLEKLETLPIYPGVVEFIAELHTSGYKLGLVTSTIRSEVEFILKRMEIDRYFETIVTGDEITHTKPEPDGYLLAIDRLNKLNPDLSLSGSECLAIEHTFTGIQTAKHAGIQVVAIAHTYPFHMLQRQANWTIDYFPDLELDRVAKSFAE
jgi:beta-phosphoglucomutase